MGLRADIRGLPARAHAGRALAVTWLAILVGAALRQALLVRSFRYFVDDAFIFLRYARQAAEGHGLVYNSGQHVMGYTSPLYVLLLSGIGSVLGTSHLVGYTNVADLLLFAGASGVLVRLARRGHASLLVLLLAWLGWFPLVAAGVNGMETMLFVLLMFGAVALATEERLGAAAVCASLGILTRPEGVIFAVVLGGAVIWHGQCRRRLWPGMLAAGTILLAWGLYALATYGSVIPESIRAKGAATGTAAGPLEILSVIGLGLSSAQYDALRPGTRALLLAAGCIALICILAGLVTDIRRRAVTAAIPAWFVLTWMFYVIGKPVQLWSWYSAPTTLALWWTVARHGPTLVEGVLARFGRRRSQAQPRRGTLSGSRVTGRLARRGSPATTVTAAVTAVAVAASLAVGIPKRSASLQVSVVRLRVLDTYIHEQAPGARSLLIDDIGIVGWDSDYEIIDGAGLVSPVADERAHGQLLSSATLIQRTKPDVVVLKADPTGRTTTNHAILRRRLYDNAAQKSALLAAYRVLPLYGLGGYRALLVRKGLKHLTRTRKP